MKKTLLLLFMGLMLMSVMAWAIPSTTVSSANTYLQGATNSITCTVAGNATEVINSTAFWYRNTSSGAWGTFGQNNTGNITVLTMNFNSVNKTESTGFQLNCTTYTGSVNYSSAVISKTLDNTAPTVTASLDYAIANKFQKVDCAVLSSDATAGIANYSTNLTKPDSTSVSSSPSNGIQEYGIDDINQPTDSGYTATCLLTDSAGNKGQASATFGVSSLDGQARKAEYAGVITSQAKAGNMKKVVILVGALFLVGISVVMMTKKSKRRRR